MPETTSQEVVRRTPQQELVARVRSDEFRQQVALALPENVPANRFVRATVTALAQNPELADADQPSLFTSVIRCAQDGLMPDGRQAALVVFNTKVKENGRETWVKKVQYLPMVDGFRLIAAEHGWSIRARVVHVGDEFDYQEGLEPTLWHRPARGARGERIYAYAVGTHRDGRREFVVMDADDIGKVRQSSRARDYGPWVDWPERMWEKTVARRLFKQLPLDPADRRVASILDASELEPADAAARLYGPDTPALPRGTPAVSPDRRADALSHAEPHEGRDAAAPPGGVPGTDDRETGGQQAAADDQSPSAAAPRPDEEQEPALPFQVPEKAIDEAADVKVPKGDWKGLSLTDIAGKGADGQRWFAWALARKAGYWSEGFRASLELYVQHRQPAVWAAFESAKAGSV